jgi:O-methyltransferase
VPPRLTQTELQRAQLEAVGEQPIEASGPAKDPESLRRAYLDLLKLTLCDLVGGRTLTVGRSGDGRDTDQPLFTRQLSEQELSLRAIGADWPFSGLTMVGLARLNDLQACVESVVADGVAGDLIEAGAWRGGASILMRATLDALGETDRMVWVADSFEGLPRPDERFPEDRNLDLSWLDYLAIPQDEVRRNFERFGLDHGVRFVEGFFEDTLPTLSDRTWALMRLDGDTYEATRIALESLYPGLSAGGYVVVDDYQLISECRKAVDDYREECGITEPIEMIDDNAARWRRVSEEAVSPRRERVKEAPRERSARSVERRPDTHIPSLRELELRRELDQLRNQLGQG